MTDSISHSASSESVIQDLALLYELVSNVGQSLYVKENCKRFLKVLMARKSLKYASVWINHSYAQNASESSSVSLELAYGSPTFLVRDTHVPIDHPLWTCIPNSQPYLIVNSATQPELFQSLVLEKRIQSGLFVLLRLGDVGILKLYSSTSTQALSNSDILKILKVIQKFTFSLKACLAYEHTLKEKEQGQQSLQLADRKISSQLKVLEKSQKELAVAKQQVDDKNKRLVKALAKLKTTQAQLVQTEKMSSLSQLVAGIAHEINNPISFIKGNVGHVKSSITDLVELVTLYQQGSTAAKIEEKAEEIDLEYLLSDFTKALESIEYGVERISRIVLSLRLFSRLDESAQKPADLHEGLDSALTILRHRLNAQPNRPAIRVIRTYGEFPKIECYPGPLNQVFMSLILNAIDAIEELSWHQLPTAEQPTLTITTKLLNASWVETSIHNNGPLIPAAVQKKLFEPFFTTKPVGRGAGLGLAICHQIVTGTHNGNIQCVSKEGEGTQFIVRLPTKIALSRQLNQSVA